MKILVTGAAGRLGRAVCEAAKGKHETVGIDTNVPPGAQHIQKVDITDFEAVKAVAAGCDAIIHTAALHGAFLKTAPRADYFRVNGVGTDNLYQAAVAHGIKRFVYSSTLDVFGHTWYDYGARVLDESCPPNPITVYGLTKLLGEHIGHHYASRQGIRVAALRYASFDERPWQQTGLGLIGRWVWVGDVAQANLLAAESDRIRDDVFLITTRTKLREEDLIEGIANPEKILERRWPGSVELLKKAGVKITPTLYPLVDISKAQRILGYEPKYDFDSYLNHLREKGN
jgi:nucleoside-diphosphate-sugar epimerase